MNVETPDANKPKWERRMRFFSLLERLKRAERENEGGKSDSDGGARMRKAPAKVRSESDEGAWRYDRKESVALA